MLSSMSLKQYLQAVSAPQADLTEIGEKVLKRESSEAEDTFGESTEAETEEEVMAEVGARMEVDAVS